MIECSKLREEVLLCFFIFCTNGGKGGECRKFFQRMCQTIAEKRGMSYNLGANGINRKISFALNKWIIVCIRSSRSIKEMNPLLKGN